MQDTLTSTTNMTTVMGAGPAIAEYAVIGMATAMCVKPTSRGQDGIATAGLLHTGTDGATRVLMDAGTVQAQLAIAVKAPTTCIIPIVISVVVSQVSS